MKFLKLSFKLSSLPQVLLTLQAQKHLNPTWQGQHNLKVQHETKKKSTRVCYPPFHWKRRLESTGENVAHRLAAQKCVVT